MDKSSSLISHFLIISDPRVAGRSEHKLIDIIVMSVCGVIYSCDSFVDIAEYARSKEGWFKSFLELPGGIPSHDTFNRVFSIIDPVAFQKAFYEWTQSVMIPMEKDIIALDGKMLKASHGARSKHHGLFGMVNAWSSKAGLALAQVRMDSDKTHEKQAFKDLIDILNLKGSTVTMDANGCHANITNKIIAKEGDFVVGLKDNQRSLLKQCKNLYTDSAQKVDRFETVEKGHDREEKRVCEMIEFRPVFLSLLASKNKQKKQELWQGLNAVCRITSERKIKGKVTQEQRYYLTSKKLDAEKLLQIIRSHWEVENKLHWTLDVAFNEDSCTVHKGYAGENLAVLRQLSLNVIKLDKSSKRSVKGKRLKCGWENDYLATVLKGMLPESYVI